MSGSKKAKAGKANGAAKPAKTVSKSASPAAKKKAPVAAKPAAKKAPLAKAAKSPVVPKAAATSKAPAKKPAPVPVKSAVEAAQRSQIRPAQTKPEKKLTAPRGPSKPIILSPDYRPSEDEPFMNEMHRAYFRQKLLTWKDDLIRQTKETLAGLHEETVQHADIADRATSETDRSLELRARDRQRKLISKIDAALSRVEDGSYGYCEETGEPIGIRRLDARPIATLSLEAQERHERREKVYRED